MNSNQNRVVLVKFNLVIRFVISLNYTLDWFQTFNFVQFFPVKLQYQPRILVSFFFKLVISFGFMQIDPQLPLNFQFHPWFLSIEHSEFDAFCKIVLSYEFLQYIP
jgi:hypothetical protein